MAEVINPGMSAADVAAAIALAIAGLPTSYVGGGLPMTVAQLYASYPASATTNGLYARVSDLYHNGAPGVGGIDDIVRCRYDVSAGVYRWVPQREAYNGVGTATGGAVTLNTLITPPTLRMTSTLLGNVTITPSTTNAYVGQKYKVVMNGILGLFTATITGLMGSNLTLLGNTERDLEYAASGWFNAGN